MLRIDDTQQGQILSAFFTDALGTPMQLVAPNGETQWQAQPDDWAAVKNERGNTDQPIRFQGQWHDEESGLYYNRHRYYDPQQGRYISQDPIGLRGGTNLYGYVVNPMEAVDPLGLFDRPGDIDQSRRQGRRPSDQSSRPRGRTGNPYSRFPPAPRSNLEKVGNWGLNKVWDKVTGGISKIETATGAIVKASPVRVLIGGIIAPSEISEKQSLYYDLDGDGLSDRHFEAGMCIPGEN
ncbi:RHS repeat-associated protein [Vreelandella songnenensis]|uniref:RHS repeat-associated protein n=2 Tax=Vreelandella songnenensis TaxID=1176243 RepID=A0A2T0UI85_9GAMM|nr:RHS repeat-associated protein [Halomonas songnenensis]